MKITEVCAVRVRFPGREKTVTGRSKSWAHDAEVANPMSRYPAYKRHRSLWTPRWGEVWCRVTLEDGTLGLGQTSHGRPVAAVIDDHLGPLLVGEDIMAGEKLADMLFRLTKPYGLTGLASYAVSAIDLALWDARGKALQQPVYALLGGLQKERIFCYATGNDVEWYRELGFNAFKLACPYGPADGLDGLKRNEDFVANARSIIGPDAESDAGLLDGLRCGVYGAPRGDAAALSPEVDGGVFDPGRLRRPSGGAHAAPLADACNGRTLVHPGSVPVGLRASCRGYPSAGYQLVRRRDGLPSHRGCRRCRRGRGHSSRGREYGLRAAFQFRHARGSVV